jgi:hypothetical protein
MLTSLQREAGLGLGTRLHTDEKENGGYVAMSKDQLIIYGLIWHVSFVQFVCQLYLFVDGL